MVKIVKRGNPKRWWAGWLVTCPHCGAELELDGTERPVTGVWRSFRAAAGLDILEEGEILLYRHNGKPSDIGIQCPVAGCRRTITRATPREPEERARLVEPSWNGHSQT